MAFFILKTAMDRTPSTRAPENQRRERAKLFFIDHPKVVRLFRPNVWSLPLVLWCSVFYRCVWVHGIHGKKAFMEKRHPGGAGILSSVKKSHYESATVSDFMPS
jgi:hypothetical protein